MRAQGKKDVLHPIGVVHSAKRRRNFGLRGLLENYRFEKLAGLGIMKLGEMDSRLIVGLADIGIVTYENKTES